MKFTRVFLLLLISQQAFAQQNQTVIEIDTTSFRDTANYKFAFEYYKTRVYQNPENFYNYYQAACYSALLESHDSAIYYLSLAISLGAPGEDVLTDTDFNILREREAWEGIVQLIKQQFLNKNAKVTKPALAFELYLMGIEDQRWRTLAKNYKLKEKPKQISLEAHDKRVDRLNEILKESGWPKYSEVGKTAGDAVFYVYQHHYPKDMERVLPFFIAAGKQGEADLGKAAMMIDRLLSLKEGIQIYGSQAHRELKQGQDHKNCKIELYPIADEENMRRRREALGMDDFNLNCKRLNVNYVDIKDRVGYKPVPLKKKWIRKGYVLVE